MYSIRKRFRFECSHRLNGLKYDSPCRAIHGHSYEVWVEIKAYKLDASEMVTDFSNLKFVKEYLDNEWDHALILSKHDSLKDMDCLKDQKLFIMDTKFTTAENMATHLCHYVVAVLSEEINDIYDRFSSIKVEVAETVNNIASYKHIFKES